MTWALRALHESYCHEKSCFITLTFTDESMLARGHSKLDKSDVQLFFKRLLKNIAPGSRRFYCGEYGESFGRPHYHAIIFGWSPPVDSMYEIRIKQKRHVMGSKVLDDLWPYGEVTVGDVSFDVCKYVASYVMKKQYGLTKTDEFAGMSNRPGLGYRWMLEHADQYLEQGYCMLDGHKCPLPRYYKNKILELKNLLTFDTKYSITVKENEERYLRESRRLTGLCPKDIISRDGSQRATVYMSKMSLNRL